MDPLLLAVAVIDEDVRLEAAAPTHLEASPARVRVSYRFSESSRRREKHRFRLAVRADEGEWLEVERTFDDRPVLHDKAHGDLMIDLPVSPARIEYQVHAERLVHGATGLVVQDDQQRAVSGEITFG